MYLKSPPSEKLSMVRVFRGSSCMLTVTQSTVQTGTMCWIFLSSSLALGPLQYALLSQVCLVPGFWQPHWHHWHLDSRSTKWSLTNWGGLCVSHHCLLGSVKGWKSRALHLLPLCYSQRLTRGRGRGVRGGKQRRCCWRNGISPFQVQKIMGYFFCREFRTKTKLVCFLVSLCAGDSKQYQRKRKVLLPTKANHSHHSFLLVHCSL